MGRLMATSYRQLKVQIEKLKKEAESARKKEASSAIAKIKALIKEFDLTPADLGFKQASVVDPQNGVVVDIPHSRPKKAPGTPKYRDPKTGKTWTGHGNAPGWIAASVKAGKVNAFLIEKPKFGAKVAAIKKPVVSKKKVSSVMPAAPAKSASVQKPSTASTTTAAASGKKAPATKPSVAVAKVTAAKPLPAGKVAPKLVAPTVKSGTPVKNATAAK